MKPAGILTNVFLVLSALTLAASASLPLRRTSLFWDRETPRRQYEEFIASRQIRSNGDSPSSSEEEKPAPAATQPMGSLKFHNKPPSQLTVAMNDRLVLTCDVSGAPPPVVYWLKNGHPIAESPFKREDIEESTNKILESESTFPERGLASTKSRLVIDCVDGDAEAIYTCVAQSRTEKIVASTYVHIEGEAPYNETACIMRHEMDLLPASIFMWSGTYIDKEGEDAVVICRAAGNPLPKISWYFGEDELILPGPNFQILPSGDLKIRRLRWKDHMGLYKCRAKNEFGTDESGTFVYPVVNES